MKYAINLKKNLVSHSKHNSFQRKGPDMNKITLVNCVKCKRSKGKSHENTTKSMDF